MEEAKCPKCKSYDFEIRTGDSYCATCFNYFNIFGEIITNQGNIHTPSVEVK